MDVKRDINTTTEIQAISRKDEIEGKIKNVVPEYLPLLTANNLIQRGIKSINSIAETDLGFESKTDKKGRITEFALSYETFKLKKKIRNN